MDERALIKEAKRAYHREYMRDYRKLNPEKVQGYRDNWFLKRALAAKEVKMEMPLESMTPKDKALFELEQLKNKQLEFDAREAMKLEPSVPTFY
ncbi:hypothetical protein [Brevibacillus laterosporus]|uniref:hypothetical protein n=1 Tax=Brevibacillus laterosporus TaxID=1465 RepID=UPI00215D0E5E|nr:hypothetical protein [Brevibacillus laterosporus]MCR8996507.1 hypothetical protein [Brevibacillus laterosporus]